MQPIHFSPLRYRSTFARIILLTLESHLSQDVLHAVLYSAGLYHYIKRYPAAGFQPSVPAADIQTLFATLEITHTPAEAIRLAHLCGQAIARDLLATRQEPAGPPLPMHALPLPTRQETGLQILNALLGEFCAGHNLHTVPGSSGYLFVLETPGSQSDTAIQHLMLGFLAEGMRIFTLGEREYRTTLVSLPNQKTGLYLHSLAS